MNLAFTHTGKRFFFITLALEGRPEALSELVDEQSRPRLTALGEIVKAAFVAVHQVWPAATLSDFVIMPDHIHFILIVNYEVAPDFNPLFFSHILMTAIEQGWANHHGQGSGAPEPPAVEGLPRFDRRAYIELAFTAPMLRTIRHYIKLNPARRLWKLAHPDRFLCHPNINAQLLKRLPPRRWQGMGNLTLLGSPFLFHVRLTLKKSVAEHEAAICEIVDKAKHGWVPVSGFISPGEVEALRRLKATPGTRFIKMLPCALPPRYDPSAEDSRELAADRLLILSGFADTPAVPARDIRKHLAASHQFRANCLAMNDLAVELCSVATGA